MLMILASAVFAGVEAFDRLVHPAEPEQIGLVLAAGIAGFLGNEAVALYRIRVGRRIGSAALVADGLHTRTDGFTSLGVVVSALAAYAGIERADPVVGLAITAVIGWTLVRAARGVLHRILDGTDEETITLIEAVAASVQGVEHVTEARARWTGHRLRAELSIDVDPEISVERGHDIAEMARAALLTEVPRLGDAAVHVDPTSTARTPRAEASFASLPRTIGRVDQTPTMPPPPTREHCYRHPNVETGVHCTRCGRPICPDCMIPAPVGHQCPECVAEARREYRQGPGRQVAVANLKATPVTKILLIAMALGYLWESAVAGGPGSLFGGPGLGDLIDAGALVPVTGGTALHPVGGIVGGEWWRLLSSIFLHAGLIHLALNSYVLWIFGVEIERQIGRLFTLAVFLVTGVFAGATSFAFAPGFIVGVGASGAIFGLVGAFIAYNYLRRHHVMAQARLRGALSMLLINLVIGFSIPGIDWRAHVGGLVAGLVAGFAVDPSRPPALRRTFATVGLLALLVGAVALVIFRTAQINANPSILLNS